MLNFTSLLAEYDLVLDNYEVRQTNGLIKTVSLLIDNRTVYTDVFMNGKCITGNEALNMFMVLCENDLNSVQIVSKHNLARAQRHNRRREYDYCPALFSIIKLINGEEEEEEEISRYDNHINSELLPDYSIKLSDNLLSGGIFQEEELFQLNPVVKIERSDLEPCPYQWDENGFKQVI